MRAAGGLTGSDASQSQTQGFELACLSIYSIDERLVCRKGPVPQTQNYRISTTQGNKGDAQEGFQ